MSPIFLRLLSFLIAAAYVSPALPADECRLEPVLAGGLASPGFITQATTSDSALHVVEQAGTIRILRAGVPQFAPWLDIRDRIVAGGELGLLGLAFHPRYAQNGRFFVNYTTDKPALRTVVSEFRTTPGSLAVDSTTERQLLTFDQPFSNHNGGHLAFGPDGKLYIGSGDGGSGGDPFGNGQNLQTLLGKILRIDVDGAAPYAIPASNPFVGQAPARPETWAYGLRNPWRFSFDRETELLFCGDVGQIRLEEIDVIVRGANYGWDVMEGSLCHEPVSGCDRTGRVSPVAEYGRSMGVSVTGGYVYRGQRLPGLRGIYIYGDFSSRRVFGFRLEAGTARDGRQLLTAPDFISSFGEDSRGEIYVLGYSTGHFVFDPSGNGVACRVHGSPSAEPSTEEQACFADQKKIADAIERYSKDNNIKLEKLDPGIFDQLVRERFLKRPPQDRGQGPATANHFQIRPADGSLTCTVHGSETR